MFLQLLKKRLGCAGWQADRVLDRLRSLVPDLIYADSVEVGLEAADIEELYQEFELDEIAHSFGVVHGQRRALWWGSALADIARSTRPGLSDAAILREGALFHLGFHLYDAIIDLLKTGTASLAEALDPSLLRERLLAHDDATRTLTCPDPDVNRIVRLFDAGLASAGKRLATDPRHADHALDLLTRQIESQLGISSDPFEGKELPHVFVGALAIGPSDELPRELMDHLARFFAMGDDWADLLEDMLRGSPNAFLSAREGSRGRRIATYAGRSAARLVAGQRMHASLAQRLAQPLQSALPIADAIGPTTYAKTVALCRGTMGSL